MAMHSPSQEGEHTIVAYVTVWWFIASPMWLAADMILAQQIWRRGRLLGNGTDTGIRATLKNLPPVYL